MNLGAAVMACMVVVLGGVAVWAGLRRLADLPPRRRAWLAVLRGLAILALAAAVFDPQWLLSSSRSRLSTVFVVLDHSASMDLPDMGQGVTRRAAIQATVLARAGLLDQLAHERLVEAYRLAGQLLPLAGRALPPPSDSTDFRVALRQLHAEAARAHPRAIVLFTDGVDTEGLTSADAALIARGLPPIFAVPVGGRSPLLNRAILGLKAPRQTPAGRDFDCTVSASSPTEAGQALSVTWSASDGQSGRVPLKLGADGNGSATWHVAAGRPGKLRIIARLGVAKGEYTAEDNVRAAMVDVVAGERRVVYLDSSPRPELASLRRLLDRLEGIKLSLVVREATGEWSQEVPTLTPLAKLDMAKSLSLATVVILGDMAGDMMPKASWAVLDRRVAAGEAGLLVLGGPNSVKMPGLLRDRLPASPTGYQQRAVTLAAPPPTSPLYAPGVRWSSLPALAGINTLGPLSQGAVVALRAANGSPLVVLRDDAIRSAIVATDSLNRLTFSASATDASRAAYNQIWLKLLAWMLRPRPPRPITLMADRLIALAGEPITVEADTSGAVDAATLEFAGPQPARRPMERRSLGLFRSEIVGLPAGHYTLVARALAGGHELGSDKLGIDVVQQSREWRHPGPYLPLLQALASATGGQVVSWDKLDRLPSMLPQSTETQVRTHRFAPARGLLAAVILLLLLAADWTLRRRWGLI